MKLKFIIMLTFCAAVLLSCKKDEVNFSDKPEIEFVSITPTNVKEFEDEVIITILYRDGDGDLGENVADVKNLFVYDERNSVEYTFRIQELAPRGSDIAIEGELDINLKTLSVIGENNKETAKFTVYLTDRAGNVSNTITTSSITVSN